MGGESLASQIREGFHSTAFRKLIILGILGVFFVCVVVVVVVLVF